MLSGGSNKPLSRDELLAILTREGEPMTEDELAECLEVLTGVQTNGGINEALPDFISAKSFAEAILGFEPEETVA